MDIFVHSRVDADAHVIKKKRRNKKIYYKATLCRYFLEDCLTLSCIELPKLLSSKSQACAWAQKSKVKLNEVDVEFPKLDE